ncbi:MAG TPA: hypothetical protein VIH00_07465, partial [Candidatus Limnocylindrales bacterium]
MQGRRPSGSLLAIMIWVVMVAASACGPAAPATSTPGTGAPPASATAGASAGSSASGAAGVEPIDYAASADPAAPAQRELQLGAEIRDDAGMVALIGTDGAGAFATLDDLTTEYGRQLVAEVAAGVDSGSILTEDGAQRLDGLVASVDGAPPAVVLPPGVIDVSLFAETGFTASAILTMLTPLVERAGEGVSGELPKQESFDKTDGGLRQQVDLNTTIVIAAGGGKVSADVIMAATDRITNAATGSFVALYTSRSTGHFEVEACPDRNGVAKGTYTFETRHELNDVGGVSATRSVAGRAVNAPFTLHNGDDARLQRIEADLALRADAAGPGTPGGPGPTGPFDWTAALPVHITMPASGGRTAVDAGNATVTGSGGERASGAMGLTSAMAQLFLGQVAAEAERFWRSGECIVLEPSRDTGSVDASETISLVVKARAKFGDGAEIDRPIKAEFDGKESLSPTGQPQPAPATFTFKAGAEKDDKGTIDLEQTSNRGIGKRRVEYTVGEQDYKVDYSSGGNRLSGTKCGGKLGEWVINVESQEATGVAAGTYTFTITRDSDSAAVVGILDASSSAGTAHWDIAGRVTFVPATDTDPPMLKFGS